MRTFRLYLIAPIVGYDPLWRLLAERGIPRRATGRRADAAGDDAAHHRQMNRPREAVFPFVRHNTGS